MPMAFGGIEVGHWRKLLQRRGQAEAEADAEQSAEEADDDGLDEELQQDVLAARADGERSPISRVRSVTDTSMMFMMPIPPTSSDTPAMAASSVVIVRVVSVRTLAISSCVRTMKSSGSPGWSLCRVRSTAPIASRRGRSPRS